jgi:hypothetical protein
MISENGFDAVEAANADTAIAILEARPDVQVVLAGIRLPIRWKRLKFAGYRERRDARKFHSPHFTVRDHDGADRQAARRRSRCSSVRRSGPR